MKKILMFICIFFITLALFLGFNVKVKAADKDTSTFNSDCNNGTLSGEYRLDSDVVLNVGKVIKVNEDAFIHLEGHTLTIKDTYFLVTDKLFEFRNGNIVLDENKYDTTISVKGNGEFHTRKVNITCTETYHGFTFVSIQDYNGGSEQQERNVRMYETTYTGTSMLLDAYASWNTISNLFIWDSNLTKVARSETDHSPLIRVWGSYSDNLNNIYTHLYVKNSVLTVPNDGISTDDIIKEKGWRDNGQACTCIEFEASPINVKLENSTFSGYAAMTARKIDDNAFSGPIKIAFEENCNFDNCVDVICFPQGADAFKPENYIIELTDNRTDKKPIPVEFLFATAQAKNDIDDLYLIKSTSETINNIEFKKTYSYMFDKQEIDGSYYYVLHPRKIIGYENNTIIVNTEEFGRFQWYEIEQREIPIDDDYHDIDEVDKEWFVYENDVWRTNPYYDNEGDNVGSYFELHYEETNTLEFEYEITQEMIDNGLTYLEMRFEENDGSWEMTFTNPDGEQFGSEYLFKNCKVGKYHVYCEFFSSNYNVLEVYCQDQLGNKYFDIPIKNVLIHEVCDYKLLEGETGLTLKNPEKGKLYLFDAIFNGYNGEAVLSEEALENYDCESMRSNITFEFATIQFYYGEFGSIDVLSGTKVDSVPTPTNSEYEFLGWYIDKDLTIPFDATQALTNDVTLYAKWSSSEDNGGNNPGPSAGGGEGETGGGSVSPAPKKQSNIGAILLIVIFTLYVAFVVVYNYVLKVSEKFYTKDGSQGKIVVKGHDVISCAVTALELILTIIFAIISKGALGIIFLILNILALAFGAFSFICKDKVFKNKEEE